MIVRTLTIASLLLACASSPAQTIEATGSKPAPLKVTPPSSKATSLIRWHGAVGSRPDYEIGQAEWTPDGSRLLTSRKQGTVTSVEIWNASEDRKSLSYAGSINIGVNWDLSPDGKRIVGQRFDDVKSYSTFEMHDLDTLEGIWVTSMGGPNKLDTAFSKDGKWLAILSLEQRDLSDKRDYAVTILEVETGKQVQRIRLAPDREPSNFSFQKMDFTKDALWIAPLYNEDGQTARISIGDWKMTFVSDPIFDEFKEGNVTISADEKWIVIWGGARYRAMQKVADKLALRFEGETEWGRFGPQGFGNANISPDSKLLTVSGNGKHKVIDLEDQKVVHEDARECLCGLFTPDGITFWGTCSPFRPVDPKTWVAPAETVPGHRNNIEFVSFSPDGKLLASQDAESIYLWSVDGSAPPRKLVTAPGGGSLRALEWKPDGTEVWSADGENFIRWHLSASVPPGTPQHSEKLFPGLKPGEKQFPWMQTIKAIPGSDLCYLSVAHKEDFSYRLYEEVRAPSKPAVVKPVMGRVLLKGHLNFSSSGEEIFDIEDNTLLAFKWSDGTVRKGMDAKNADLAGGGTTGPLVLINAGQIVLVDPATLQQTRAFMPPHDGYYSTGLTNLRGCISQDGKWFACSSHHRVATPGKRPYYLVNIKDNGEAYRLPLVDNTPTCGAFSPDGRLLAMGHNGGLVSFWDVEKIQSESGLTPLGAPRSTLSRSFRATTQTWEWPGPGLALTKGDTVTFTDEGGVQCKEAGILSGQFLINGKTPKALTRSIRAFVPEGATFGAISGDLELRSEDSKIRVHRSLTCQNKGITQWLDTVENLSAEPATVVLTYSTNIGAGLESLRDRDASAPSILPDGTLQSKTPLTELSARSEKDGVSRMASIAFSTPAASVQPTLKWYNADKRIVKEWTFKLQPYEKRILMLEFSQNRAAASEATTVHKLTLSNRSLLPRLSSFLNFVLEGDDKMFIELDYPNYGLDTDGTKKDFLGFKWKPEISSGMGMGAELGVDRFFDLWLDGSPVVGAPPFLTRSNTVKMGARLTKSMDGTIQSKRRHHWSPETGLLLMHDEISNTGKEKVKVNVLFNTVALNRYTQVVDAKGKVLNCTTPLPIKNTGGQAALLSEGPNKPAILLAFGGPKGYAEPSVKLVAGRGFFVGYVLEIKPRDSVSLLHLATQRPLSAYDSVSSAFAELDTAAALETSTANGWSFPANW